MTEQVQFRYSKDGGHNHSDWRNRDLGPAGNFIAPLVFRRLGRGRQWVFDVQVSDDCNRDILAMSLQIEGGDS